DLKNYYEEHIDDYKTNEMRKLSFVLFRNQASATDSNLVLKNLVNVKEIVINDTADFKSFVEIYSEVPYSVDTVDVTSLTEQVVEEFNSSNGTGIVGPVASSDGYVIYNLLDIMSSEDRVVRASHILINQNADPDQNLFEANKVYDELIVGGKFEDIAKEKSGDPGSAVNGGDLGWFTKGKMVKEFEEACFSGKVGEIQKPIKTTFGYHIIKVTNQSKRKYIVEKIVNQVKQSAATLDENYNNASDFAYLADKNGFTKEAELLGYQIQESQQFSEGTFSIPGIGSNKMLIKFSFENGLNDISDVFKLPTGFVVAKISEINPEGFIPFEEVKTGVQQLVRNERKFEQARILATDLMERVNGDITKIPALDPRLQVKSTGRFNLQTNIPTIGKDFAFINTALNLEKGETSEPVKGQRGFYIMYIIDKTPFDSSSYSIQASTIRNNLLQEKKNAFLNQWLNKLKADAEIVDNRHIFYRF
ncbi:MAG: peptidylprolyl isomerase, partial [Promethearchaeota archaeon]